MEEQTGALIRRLERTTHDVGDYLQAALADLELTQAEIHVLSFLHSANPATVSAIQASFAHTRSTLTGVLDRLERRGLVTRAINAKDRRSFVIAFTDAGRQAGNRVAEAVGALETAAAARMGVQVGSALVVGLDALDAATADDATTPPAGAADGPNAAPAPEAR